LPKYTPNPISSPNGSYPGGDQAAIEDLRDGPVDFENYWRILRRRWRVAVAVALLIFGAVAAKTLRQRKIYEAETKLVVVTKSPALDAGGDSILGGLDALKQGRNVDTQVELIDSPDLLGRAIGRKLSEKYWNGGHPDVWTDRDIRAGFGDVTPGEPLGSWTSSIKSRPDTDVIVITTHAYTPWAAAHYANAVANEYEDEDLARNRQATRTAAQWVQNQMKSVSGQLQAASAKLARFQERSHTFSPSDEASNLIATSVDIQSQCQTAKGELEAAKNRLDLLKRRIPEEAAKIDAETTVAANPEFAQVQTQIVQLEGQITEQSHEFKPISPEIQQLRGELREEQDRLRTLSRTMLASSATQPNPVRLKLEGDYVDAESNQIVAQDHADALKIELDRLQKSLQALPESQRTFSSLELQEELLKNTYSLLSERNATLAIQEQSTISNVIVASFARAPKGPSSPKVLLNLGVGLILAVIAGIALVLILDQTDKRLNQPDEFETLTGLPSLAFIPEATSPTGRLILDEAEPGHAFLESFRLLRNNIDFATLDREFRVLAVTSAAMSDGKSTTSMNLALAFAKDGKRVLVIDVDLRRPTIHKWVNSSNDTGFTSVSKGQSTLDRTVQSTEWENLWALTSGALPPDPTEFLNSEKSRQLVREAKQLYDLIILDAPPSSGLSDMQVIAKMTDGVVVVAALGITERPMLLTTIKTLRQTGAPLLGIVVNRMKRSHGGSYGNKGYYGYGNYEPDGEGKKGRKGSVRAK
jgi:succinoglycan biosynthesis transport protein ExoP